MVEAEPVLVTVTDDGSEDVAVADLSSVVDEDKSVEK